MIEVYYQAPTDVRREETIAKQVAARGGKLTCREEDGPRITLTIEFEGRSEAEAAARDLAATGVHVEGPSDY
jgi:hypothetical protein